MRRMAGIGPTEAVLICSFPRASRQSTAKQFYTANAGAILMDGGLIPA